MTPDNFLLKWGVDTARGYPQAKPINSSIRPLPMPSKLQICILRARHLLFCVGDEERFLKDEPERTALLAHARFGDPRRMADLYFIHNHVFKTYLGASGGHGKPVEAPKSPSTTSSERRKA